ncbi:hypothetical protein FOZ76_11625 [Verticiella sediminum]|uniref:Glutamate--cysteine ligase n=1 Tax=Verticiella sediminum TaxID=1247510 RepID=A0A556AQB1_9BURK|nr:glutamate-cysteine ligase family protein [Verticiella sediminum]TSH95102.1 hypothetical protein FOZ76_11625 [Verticiella sediminum]
MPKLGLEMEMVVAARATGRSQGVRRYFEAMAARKAERGVPARIKQLDGREIAVRSPGVDSGLDNAFNHLESALGPVEGEQALATLYAWAQTEIADVLHALRSDGAVLLNASEHPDTPLDDAFYRAMRAPKPIYDDWTTYRGWQHRVGIDAKAQNGPTLGVPAECGVQALNTVLGLAPAAIALFANSPLEGGRETGLQENRLTIWSRMFAQARFAGDRWLAELPPAPFADLGAYFHWVYGEGTTMHCVPAHHNPDYKGTRQTWRPDAPQSLYAFLGGEQAPAHATDTGERGVLAPCASHFEYLQFSHFLDARFRFRFARMPELAALREAWAQPQGIEKLMQACGADCYIEGRAPGANFCDAAALADMGPLAWTAVIAPSALQLGLLRNLEEASRLVSDWGWARLRDLRARAIRHALADDDLHRLAGEVLAVARAGLDEGERACLGYAQWAWANRRTGADRQLETWRGTPGDADARLARFVQAHSVLPPP